MAKFEAPDTRSTNTSESTRDFIVDAGKYLVMITESEFKSTKAGNGTGLNIKMQILDGVHQGKHIFQWINISNPSQIAMQIGEKLLAQLRLVCGRPTYEDESTTFHNIPIVAKVTKKPRKDDPARFENQVSDFLAASTSTAPATGPAPRPPVGATPPPWAAKK